MQKSFKVTISRDFFYDYEVKANSQDEAIEKAYGNYTDSNGNPNDVKLINEECYEADCIKVLDCEEISNA